MLLGARVLTVDDNINMKLLGECKEELSDVNRSGWISINSWIYTQTYVYGCIFNYLYMMKRLRGNKTPSAQ